MQLLPTNSLDNLNHRKRVIETVNAILRGQWNPIVLADGISEPSTAPGLAQIYVDTADGFLKVKHEDGTIDSFGDTFHQYGKYKTADTSRTSTTTLADDPHIAGIALPVGKYAVDAFLNFDNNGGGTQGIKFALNFTGTVSEAGISTVGVENNTPVTRNVIANYNSVITIGDVTAAINFDWQRWSGFLEVTVAGNMALQWAQEASSANGSILRRGSYLTFMRLE